MFALENIKLCNKNCKRIASPLPSSIQEFKKRGQSKAKHPKSKQQKYHHDLKSIDATSTTIYMGSKHDLKFEDSVLKEIFSSPKHKTFCMLFML